MTTIEKLSATKLAQRYNTSAYAIQQQLIRLGYIEVRSGIHYFTELGRSVGGEWRQNDPNAIFCDGHMVWPSYLPSLHSLNLKSPERNDSMAMIFRERDGVCIQYEVRGFPDSKEFPDRTDIPTLKEAVAIARTYPGVRHDGAATHIVRRHSKKYPVGLEFHHCSGVTHRWRVDADGRLQLIAAHPRSWPTTRMAVMDYVQALPVMPNRATTLRGEILDLAAVAKRIGLHEAHQALIDHAYGRRCLPDYGQSDRLAAIQSEDMPTTLCDQVHKPLWRRVIEKAIGHTV